MTDTLKSIAIPVNARTRKSRSIAPMSVPVVSAREDGELALRPQRPQLPVKIVAHNFRVGQRLAYRTAMGHSTCTVLRLLPIEKGILSYRVRSDIESYERNVEESALSLPR